MQDPLGEMLKLRNQSEDTIRQKIDGLRLAQRILMPDHSRSLFVPALLKEVIESNKKDYAQNALNRAKELLVRNEIFIF